MQATLMGLWLVPAIISVYFHFWRFVGVWAIFSGVTGYILYTCTLKRIEKTTPRTGRLLSAICTGVPQGDSTARQ